MDCCIEIAKVFYNAAHFLYEYTNIENLDGIKEHTSEIFTENSMIQLKWKNRHKWMIDNENILINDF